MSFEVAFHIVMALSMPLLVVGGGLLFAVFCAARWAYRRLRR